VKVRISLRLAALTDLATLHELIPASVRVLSRDYYTEAQIESAIRYVFGPDTQLIADGTYFIAEAEGSTVLAGCGGWSRRRTLYGGDQAKAARAAGFSALELVATLPGEPLYHAFGFEALERIDAVLPDGITVPFIRMTRAIGE
jgi:hypothetical protein